jgi:hypothetical protein
LVVASLAPSIMVERDGDENRRILKVWPGDGRPHEAEEFS